MFTLTLSFKEHNRPRLMRATDFPPKTDVNFCCGVSHNGQNIRDGWRRQRRRGCQAYLCQRKAQAAGKWPHNIFGAVQVLARALDLIFSPSVPECTLSAKPLFSAIKATFIQIGESVRAKTLSLITVRKHKRQFHSSVSQPRLPRPSDPLVIAQCCFVQ